MLGCHGAALAFLLAAPALCDWVAASTGQPERRLLKEPVYGKLRKGEEFGAPCMLKVCTLHELDAPRVYVLETYDGVGHRVANVLNGIALANKYGMNFGGVIRAPNSLPTSDHGANFHDVLDGLFGEGAADQMMFRTDIFMTRDKDYLEMKLHRKWNISFRDETDFEKRRKKEVKKGMHVYVPIASLHTENTLVGYFPEALQVSLAERLATRPLEFKPGKTSIAIHVRRGDLPKGDERATSEAYYFRLLDAILEKAPDADIHMWSSTTNTHKQAPLWSSSDFDSFRERGITVHLDDEDLLDPWAHMVHADILVSSLSYFSYTPAVLNRNCVVYAGFTVYPGHKASVPSNWINALDIEGLEAKSHYLPYRFDEDMYYMHHHEKARRMKAETDARGEVKIEFDSTSDASKFQAGLAECLARLAAARG